MTHPERLKRPTTAPETTCATGTACDDGFDTRLPPGDTFTPHGVIEMLPGVVPPLLWTINAPMLENAFRTVFTGLGADPPSLSRPLLARTRGRAALNLSALCAVAESLPGGDPLEVERQYLGCTITPGLCDKKKRSRWHLLTAIRSRAAHRRIAEEVELISTAAHAIARIDVDTQVLSVGRLVAYRQRIRDLAWRGYAAEVGASSAAGATYRALEILLEKWLPDDTAQTWAQRLTSDAIDREEPYPGPPPLRSRSMYGDEVWVGGYSTEPRYPGGPARNGRQADRYGELLEQLTRDKKWRRTRLLTGQVIDLRVRWLRRQVNETKRFISLRERAKNALLVLGGEERRVIDEAADRLVASQQLPESSLVEYMSDSELDDMLFGTRVFAETKIEWRVRAGMSCRQMETLPDWFGGSVGEDNHRPPSSSILNGIGTSPGSATGSARILASPADGVHLRSGDILVAHSTDPSWTPLFARAAGVVLETGGPLSHASIVARDLGIPAVLRVPGATRLIDDDNRVAVDGTAGKIEIVGREQQ